jgi:hypothetical protein
VTLVTLPLLVGAYARARRGSSRGRLLWLGVLWYLVYNYAFYLVGTALNDVFLLYAAVVAAGMWALGVGLAATDVDGIARRLRPTAPVRWVAGYLAIAAVGLGGAWIAQSLAFALDGTVPQIMLDTDSKTPIVFALDLTLVVPTMLVGGRAGLAPARVGSRPRHDRRRQGHPVRGRPVGHGGRPGQPRRGRRVELRPRLRLPPPRLPLRRHILLRDVRAST